MNGMRMFYENRSRQDWNRLRSAYDKVFGKAVLNTLCSEEFNSYYVENGDYWKIDNITLGYSFSKINKWIKTLRLYASVNNAITITGYKESTLRFQLPVWLLRTIIVTAILIPVHSPSV